jgi:nifR3 family TIM-barrel protein
VKSVHDGAFFTSAERPIGIQLYGADAVAMAEAAELVTRHYEPDFIDINFGCPVKKVVRRNGGSGCLRDLTLVTGIVRAVRSATHLPVTVKIRSGWDEISRDPVAIARRCEEAGAMALTLHPRTRAQLYQGRAAWHEIAAVKAALSIPVIGNGDVRTAEDVRRMHDETGCDGVMIARGSFGNPWIFTHARALLNGEPAPALPDVEERLRVALEHAQLQRAIQGDSRRTALEFRKHLAWYARGLPRAAALRQRFHQVESMDEVGRVFDEYLATTEAAVA